MHNTHWLQPYSSQSCWAHTRVSTAGTYVGMAPSPHPLLGLCTGAAPFAPADCPYQSLCVYTQDLQQLLPTYVQNGANPLSAGFQAPLWREWGERCSLFLFLWVSRHLVPLKALSLTQRQCSLPGSPSSYITSSTGHSSLISSCSPKMVLSLAQGF